MNPLKQLATLGQDVWLDDIHRDLIVGGELDRLIANDGLRGMTSNPAIFQKAFASGPEYQADILDLQRRGKAPPEIFEALAVKDVQLAADRFRSRYERSGTTHGYVSLEVNPHLANDAQESLEEARRLWRSVDRPNVFIKIPATSAGLPVIEQLIEEGINVNVTLIFSVARYRAVAAAYREGLEVRARRGEPLPRVRSVASFFLSRIDVLVDRQLDAWVREGGERGAQAARLRGQAAIACAKVAYRAYQELLASEPWPALAARHAQPQWLLWASTSTKDPAYSDVKYVEPLIGPETVNTMPRETLDAYRDHGQPQARLETGLDHARQVIAELQALGVNLDTVADQLEHEGLAKFCQPYDAALATLVVQRAAA